MPLEQKLFDFEYLTSLFAKWYAPYEWKRETVKHDLYDVTPWIARIRASRGDLEFLEICGEYLAALKDSHTRFEFSSSFLADLGVLFDIYDGKVLLDSINRNRLPAGQYPFAIGDELISIDGKPVGQLVDEIARLTASSNESSRRRLAAGRIGRRFQSFLPRAVELGPEAVVVLRRANGETATYTLPWVKTGTEVTEIGPVPSPGPRLFHLTAPQPGPDSDLQFQKFQVPEQHFVLGVGARAPVFALPQGFTMRLGAAPQDSFLSGTFQAGGLNIGFIRIPNFSAVAPPTAVAGVPAINQFTAETQALEQITDGLVIDLTRNPGGGGCHTEQLLQRIFPNGYRSLGQEVRATLELRTFAYSIWTFFRNGGAPAPLVAALEAQYRAIDTAYSENRGRTGPVSLCFIDPSLDKPPFTDPAGRVIAYSKPLIVLTDEFTSSAAEIFAAAVQDNRRGLIVGSRTNGAGGAQHFHPFAATVYSESAATVTESLVVRSEVRQAPGLPATAYLENIGVQPDVPVELMTAENLTGGGRAFTTAFTASIVDHIRRSR